MLSKLALAAAGAALIAAGACASDDHDRRTTTEDTTRQNGYRDARPTDASGTTGGASRVSEQDRRFLMEAASGNLFEIRSSELAIQKGVAGDTAQAANAILADHSQMGQELQQLASRKGISVPAQLMPKHQAQLERLRAAAASEFESQYRQIQLQAHQEAISLFERAERDAQDPDVRSLAQRSLPKLREHLQMLRG